MCRVGSLPLPRPSDAVQLTTTTAVAHNERGLNRCRSTPRPAFFGNVTAAVMAVGRKPRGRAVDLMIAATAIAEGLPLYTTNPADFTGVTLIRIVPVARPPFPH